LPRYVEPHYCFNFGKVEFDFCRHRSLQKTVELRIRVDDKVIDRYPLLLNFNDLQQFDTNLEEILYNFKLAAAEKEDE